MKTLNSTYANEISVIARLSLVITLSLMGIALLLLGLRLESPVAAGSVAIGLVPDETGVVDSVWNGLVYQGLLRAESELGVVGTVYTPTGSADYASQLQQCVDDGNALCLAVGFQLTQAITDVAEANLGTKFAIVDSYCPDDCDNFPNLRFMNFSEGEAGYLAGSLAGHMTQGDVIGAVAGPVNVPPVVRFAEGYRNGAQCANGSVEVLIEYVDWGSGGFNNPELGAQLAQEMLNEGADAIFGVAGATGIGAVMTATQSGAWGIGVDTDWYLDVFENGAAAGSDKLLSSALKHLDTATFLTISDVVSGTFTSGEVRYDLSLEGVGLAPFHEADPSVTQSVRDALALVEQGIISGTIDISDDCRAYLYLPEIEK